MTNEQRPYVAGNYKYEGNDNYGHPRTDYIAKIAGMTDDELLHETEQKIWLSAYANNNRRSDYHWHVDGCYDEWTYRQKPEQYTVAYEAARRSAGC